MDESKKQLLYSYVLRVKNERNDVAAWDYLYLGYRNYLLTVIRNIVFDTNAHQDILQEVWIKLYKHIDKYDESREFESWLGKVASNACYTWLGKNRLHAQVNDSESEKSSEAFARTVSYNDQYQEDAEESSYTDDFANSICDREALESAFNEIKDKKQVLAFKYRFVDGLPIKTISELLEVPESTLHNWIYRVKDKLAAVLKRSD